MRIFGYIFFNIYILLIAALRMIQDNKTIYDVLFITLVILLITNLVMFLIEKLLGGVIDFAFKWYEKRKMKNYNLFEWIGDSNNRIKLYDNLSKIKQFDKGSIHDNLQKIKDEIKKEFNNINKLQSLKIYLEVKVESPKLTSLNTATQTVLLALMTSSLVNLLNGFGNANLKMFTNLIVVMAVWFGLLVAISFISKQIDKFKLLLKLVMECIEEEKGKTTEHGGK
ncbi:hypothetical protein [Thermaerobacillus caldiproteolyticus]|uniref:hypothetical protein n=1 Tax=Thermaerobacillus caldiproteolyticus TaxID=247480 RepID=UPI0018F19DD8|nr:hypothetical protein [Anoxybacillus caldiproteolyticus]